MIDDPGAERRARAGVDAMTLLLLGRWVRRWGVILAVTLVLGLVEDQLMPIFYISLAFAGIMLVVVLATRRVLNSKLSQGRPPIIETEAREVEDDPTLIDITPKDREQ
ncbi:hypothetical protein [Sphingomicrobium astaxanthinifaciens]|uniref:hypothetical protein n=1 Tax=Sphingomicrobium astaxanthinifaciens TaxID=1227949 RepID=UPI001FCC367A|nr:hypothetical protein [Sphingomicrobium astaxanthinifaciens]MCJ7422284.1 hypothetical protein [Sphingomicrobium astaxanthinifaciens]